MTYRYTYIIVCTADEMKNYFYVGKHTTTNLNDNYKGGGKYIREYHEKYPNQYVKCILGFYNNDSDLLNAENELIMTNWNNPFCLNIAYITSIEDDKSNLTTNIISSINFSLKKYDFYDKEYGEFLNILQSFLRKCLYVKSHGSVIKSYTAVVSSPQKSLRIVTLLKMYIICETNKEKLYNFISSISINYEHKDDERYNGIAHKTSRNILKDIKHNKHKNDYNIIFNTLWKDIDEQLIIYGRIIEYIISKQDRLWNSVMLFVLLDKPNDTIKKYFNVSTETIIKIEKSSDAKLLKDILDISEKTILQKMINL